MRYSKLGIESGRSYFATATPAPDSRSLNCARRLHELQARNQNVGACLTGMRGGATEWTRTEKALVAIGVAIVVGLAMWSYWP